MKQPAYSKLSAVALAVTLAGCASSDNKANTEDNVLEKTSTPKALVLTAAPLKPSEKWDLLWSDEFDGDEIDKKKWEFVADCWGGGNNEQQCYTTRKSNAFIEDGKLNIVAKKGSFTGPDNADGNPGTRTLPYTSAKLRSVGKGNWKYGRFEVRAKLPYGQGTWPAFWMLPTDWVYGGWAASGEIDIMEAVNLKTASTETGAADGELESRVFGSLHYGKPWPDNVFTGQATHLPGNVNPADDFHTYAIEWEEGEIRWYLDNVHFATQRADGWYSQHMEDGVYVSGGKNAPFDQKFHMLLNLAVGGNWAANANDGGIDSSVFPQTLAIDYVRVYRCSADRWKGKGCAAVSEEAKLVEGTPEPEILIGDGNFGKGPVFNVYNDALAVGAAFDGYDPKKVVTQEEVDEEGRGKVWKITKTGDVGNVYLRAPQTDMSHWMDGGELVFDLNIVSKEGNPDLLIKMDSGWPNASDIAIEQPAVGTWSEVRINVADLISRGNRFAGGKADISRIRNILVIEPLGPMTMKVDNIRFEYASK
ncbi:glycoside hydrolase family 16 protein [Psychromonas sp. MME1]|uniref:glycoside hydrolase family 16 protein n=1 Tax=Psychromonas sp. MME1 TaxID=3231032 RepID=UPI0034E2271C